MNVIAPSPSQGLEQSFYYCETPPLDNSAASHPEIPSTSLYISNLEFIEHISVSSGHSVEKMRILDGSDKGHVVYFKADDATYPPLLAQGEAGISASYRLARGPGSAKVVPVVNDLGQVIGSASFELAGFRPLTDQFLLASEMIEMGIAEELVARYMRMEDDLHPGNIGTTSYYGIGGIDDDMSFYPITSVLKGRRAINNGIISPIPSEAFPVTHHDIDNFPETLDNQPCHWPPRRPKNGYLPKAFKNSEEFRKLSQDRKFKELMHFAFLKELLISPETHALAMNPNFSETPEAEKMLREMHEAISLRWEAVENVLIDIAEFRKYMIRNKTVLQDCLENLGSLPAALGEAAAPIDIDDVKVRYDRILRKCMAKDLALTMLDLGSELKRQPGKWAQWKKQYYQLLDRCINFEKAETPFWEALNELELEHTQLCNRMGAAAERWKELCDNFSIVLNNYRPHVAQKEDPLVRSIFLRHSQGDMPPPRAEGLDLEYALAKAIHKTLSTPGNNRKIAKIAKECLEEYKPAGYETRFSSLNPLSWSRGRVPDLESLVRILQAPSHEPTPKLITRFLSSGNWCATGYLTGASANVLLICRLSEAILEGFKTSITLEQLRRHDLVEVCYAKQSGNWDLETSAKKISDLLCKLSQEKVNNPPSSRLSRMAF